MKEKLKHTDVISLLNLEPLPEEGGFFRQTYKSTITVNIPGLGERVLSTAIYYLITNNESSALHRLKQNELFHFYAGDPVEMMQLPPEGEHKISVIGNDLQQGHVPQMLVPAGVWQGLKLMNANNENWALLGATVTPGFEFDDFELASPSSLIDQFPHLTELIKKFTK